MTGDFFTVICYPLCTRERIPGQGVPYQEDILGVYINGLRAGVMEAEYIREDAWLY